MPGASPKVVRMDSSWARTFTLETVSRSLLLFRATGKGRQLYRGERGRVPLERGELAKPLLPAVGEITEVLGSLSWGHALVIVPKLK